MRKIRFMEEQIIKVLTEDTDRAVDTIRDRFGSEASDTDQWRWDYPDPLRVSFGNSRRRSYKVDSFTIIAQSC